FAVAACARTYPKHFTSKTCANEWRGSELRVARRSADSARGDARQGAIDRRAELVVGELGFQKIRRVVEKPRHGGQQIARVVRDEHLLCLRENRGGVLQHADAAAAGQGYAH